jgi:hypothetical protein
MGIDDNIWRTQSMPKSEVTKTLTILERSSDD